MKRDFRAPVLAMASLMAFAQPARAQLGGLVNRAKAAAAQQMKGDTTKKAAPASAAGLPSDRFGEELDDASLGGVLKGLQVMSTKADQRDALRKQQEGLADQLAKSEKEHANDQSRYDQARQGVRECFEAFFQKRRADLTGGRGVATGMQMAAGLTTPAMQQAQIQFSQEMAAAMQKGDTVAAKRITQAYSDKIMALAGIDLHADSAVAAKQCGAFPARPSWMAAEDDLRARINALGEQIRQAENDMQLGGVAASGMSAAKFALARERLINWSAGRKLGRPVQQFGAKEKAILDSRAAEIERLLTALLR